MRFRLAVDGEAHDIEVEPRGTRLHVTVDGASYRATVRSRGDTVDVAIRGSPHSVRREGSLWILDGEAHEVRGELAEDAPLDAVGSDSAGPRIVEVRPPMPGRLVRLAVAAGMAVRRGQPVAVLEAMKMQNEIPAPADGVVQEVRVKEGESIPADRVIVVLEARRG